MKSRVKSDKSNDSDDDNNPSEGFSLNHDSGIGNAPTSNGTVNDTNTSNSAAKATRTDNILC